jgi:type IV secretion system protein VirB6
VIRVFRIVSILAVLVISGARYSNADDVSELKDTISSLTCESQFISNFISGEAKYSCVKDTVFGEVIANLIAPVTYFGGMMYTRMDENDLFPNNCTMKSDPYNPQITFGVCSNIKLYAARIDAAAKVVASLFTGSTTQSDALSQVWNVPKSQYYDIESDVGLNESGSAALLGGVPFSWTIVMKQDKVCVAIDSIFGTSVPLGCKYTSEPYPFSRYSGFFNAPGTNQWGIRQWSQDKINSIKSSQEESMKSVKQFTKCHSAGSCYTAAMKASKTPLPISGPLISCIREAIIQMLVSSSACNFEQAANEVTNNQLTRQSSTLFSFQHNMRRAVSACLTMYVIFIGFRILLGGEMPPRGEVITYLIKFVLVLYFSVGINNSNGTFNGMTQYTFPVLFNGMGEIAGWVMNASDSNLCNFQPSGSTTSTAGEAASGIKYSDLVLWDALDCRIYHYLGLNFTVPAYMYFIIPAVYFGQINIVMLILSYPIMVISVAAYVVSAFIISMIGLAVLGVLAPIFIPLVLFEHTKGYFESWAKLLISFMLQPAILSTFMVLMFSVFDKGFYNGCEFSKYPDANNKMVFKVKSEKNDYASEENYNKCMVSLGWMLNSTSLSLSFGDLNVSAGSGLSGAAASATGSSATSSSSSTNTATAPSSDNPLFQNTSNVLKNLKSSVGFFYNVATMSWSNIKDMALAMLSSCFLLYMMYHLSSELCSFATDMTEGISINTPISPQSVMQGASFVADRASTALKEAKLNKGGISESEGVKPPTSVVARSSVAPPTTNTKNEVAPPTTLDKNE